MPTPSRLEPKIMKYEFIPPRIIGAICRSESDIPSEILKAFRRLEPRFALLPFVVERRHLKNVVACMRLMDIPGILVTGPHRRWIADCLPRLDAGARAAGCVDMVVRKGRGFIGLNAMSLVGKQVPRKRKGAKRSLHRGRDMGLFCQTCVGILTHPRYKL